MDIWHTCVYTACLSCRVRHRRTILWITFSASRAQPVKDHAFHSMLLNMVSHYIAFGASQTHPTNRFKIDMQ